MNGLYWRDHFNSDSGSLWKLVRLDRHRQFTRGSTGNFRPNQHKTNIAWESEGEGEIKRFVAASPPLTPPPSPSKPHRSFFIIPPFFCPQLVCSAHPLPSWIPLVFQSPVSLFCACPSCSFFFYVFYSGRPNKFNVLGLKVKLSLFFYKSIHTANTNWTNLDFSKTALLQGLVPLNSNGIIQRYRKMEHPRLIVAQVNFFIHLRNVYVVHVFWKRLLWDVWFKCVLTFILKKSNLGWMFTWREL